MLIMRLPSLDSLVSKTIVTFKRFPFAIAAAITGSIFCMLWVNLRYNLEESHYYYSNIIMSCYLGMLLFIAIQIYVERKKLKTIIAILLKLLAVAALICYYFSLPEKFMVISFTRFSLFTIALHLLIAFVPFITKGELNGFWQYNKIIFLRILTSALYTIVLYLGLALAIEKLFKVNISGKIYSDLWILLTGIFNTWFFLAGFPLNFSELDLKKDYPKGLKIFTQYILLPLVSIYLLILYAYMFRIIITAQWPVGWVSYLVIGFSIGGILSLLLIYPVRNDENNKWILIFSHFFYFALFPLIILLFLAVKRRVNDYGITEQRYFILILALWLLFIAVYFLLSKSKNIKLIPVSLCILTLAASFGPWGAFNVSLASQENHLKSLLNKYSMLDKGKIVKAKDTIAFKDHKQISSIIDYLVSVHGYKTLQPYFVQNLDSLFNGTQDNYDYNKVDRLHSMMNISRVYDYQTEINESVNTYFEFYTNSTNHAFAIQGYDYFISDYSSVAYNPLDSSCNTYLLEKNSISICYDPKKEQIAISSGKDSSILFDLSSLIGLLEKKYGDNRSVPQNEMILISENSFLKAKIVFKEIHYQKHQKQKNNISDVGVNAAIFIKEQ
jgi:hypothetical protein